MEKSCEASMT